MFEGSGTQITTAGGKYLGAAIGKDTFKEAFVKKKVEQWKAELENLAQVAPHSPNQRTVFLCTASNTSGCI